MHYLRDFDDETMEDISIEAEHYKQLISLCFRYCTHFSLLFRDKSVEDNLMLPTPLYRQNAGKYSNVEYLCFYACSIESQNFLLTKANLFDWLDTTTIRSPEDLIFYREDGSVFFWSETHEGICALFERNQEDVAMLVSQRGWVYYDPQEEGNHVMIPKSLYMTE